MQIFSFEKEPRVEPRITFTDQDLVGVHHLHEDDLIVSLRISNFDVRRILIDNGSSVNEVFPSTLKKMDFDMRRLEPAKSNLTGLSREVKVPEGCEMLLITVGEDSNYVTTLEEFHVVNSFSSYNIIIGRQWLHDLGIIPSSFHQCMKLIIRGAVVTARGDQKETREYGCTALKSSNAREQLLNPSHSQKVTQNRSALWVDEDQDLDIKRPLVLEPNKEVEEISISELHPLRTTKVRT